MQWGDGIPRDGTSRKMREYQIRFCEKLSVKFTGLTRQPPPYLLGKSSRSRFTCPQLLHSTRRTSISRKMRASPHDRSRTRRVRRSYQPECTRPQQLQIVFLSAV